MKESFFVWLKQLKKEQILVMVLLLGLVMVIFLPTGDQKEENVPETSEAVTSSIQSQQETIAQQLEQQLVNTLQQVDGVGKVTAAVTLETSGTKIVEKDIPVTDSTSRQVEENGSEQSSITSSSEEETVYEQDRDGNQIPYVVSETTPEIRGVVIVAQGGGNPVIQQQIQEAAEALFHIEAHKIKVMKMK